MIQCQGTILGRVRELKAERKKKVWTVAMLLVTAVPAYAQGGDAGFLQANESLLLWGGAGLLGLLLLLIAWEIYDQKSASRSSLDIAKLAAAAAKKHSASAPPSGSLTSLGTLAAASSGGFAPPPPPPPAAAPPSAGGSGGFSAPPPPPPPSAPPAGGVFSPPASDVAASRADEGGAGGSGGWADLLQRVRAGEPEAASFQSSSPPPSTEDETFAQPPASPGSGEGFSPQVGGAGLQPSASATGSPDGGAAGGSSEAWEALLKRTTKTEDSLAGGPGGDPGKISLSSSFSLPGEKSEESGQAPAAFNLGGGPPAPGPGGSGLGGFSLPGSTPPPSAGDSGGFSLPGTSPAGGSPFALPGAGDASMPGAGGGGFKLPGGLGDSLGATMSSAPGGFDFGSAPPSGGPQDLGSTLPLSDMFGSKPTSDSAPPAFQLPGSGGSGVPSAFDTSKGTGDSGGGIPGGSRKISLDFASGGGQTPPPPLPKTEG